MTSVRPSCCHQFGSNLNPSELFWQVAPDSDKWQHNWAKFQISKPIHTYDKLIVQDTNVPQKNNEAGRDLAIDSAILDKLKHLWNCYWFSSTKQLDALGSFIQLPVLISASLSLYRGTMQPCALTLSYWQICCWSLLQHYIPHSYICLFLKSAIVLSGCKRIIELAG